MPLRCKFYLIKPKTLFLKCVYKAFMVKWMDKNRFSKALPQRTIIF